MPSLFGDDPVKRDHPRCAPHGKLMPCHTCAYAAQRAREAMDAEAARKARDEGLERVAAGHSSWCDEAYRAVVLVAGQRDEFIVDDVWSYVDEPKEPRAMGAVMRQAVADGVIAPTETYRPSARRTAHRNPRRVWKSLVRPGGVTA